MIFASLGVRLHDLYNIEPPRLKSPNPYIPARWVRAGHNKKTKLKASGLSLAKGYLFKACAEILGETISAAREKRQNQTPNRYATMRNVTIHLWPHFLGDRIYKNSEHCTFYLKSLFSWKLLIIIHRHYFYKIVMRDELSFVCFRSRQKMLNREWLHPQNKKE